MEAVIRIEAWADGAVAQNGQPGPMGIAVVCRCGNQCREFSATVPGNPATNNRAELLAIKLALEKIKPEKRAGTEVVIRSDSQWSVRALDGSYSVSANLDLIGEIRALAAGFAGVTFEWVRGHSGEQNNERANFLAQKAAR